MCVMTKQKRHYLRKIPYVRETREYPLMWHPGVIATQKIILMVYKYAKKDGPLQEADFRAYWVDRPEMQRIWAMMKEGAEAKGYRPRKNSTFDRLY